METNSVYKSPHNRSVLIRMWKETTIVHESGWKSRKNVDLMDVGAD